MRPVKLHYHIHSAPFCLLSWVLLCLFPSASFSAARSFLIAPPPQWILPPPVLNTNQASHDEEGLGIKHLLYDRQIKASIDSVERYVCRSTKVLSSAYLENVSKLEFEFEPSYQKLLIHYIRIRRGARTIDALKPREIKVIQKEDELDRELYNGALSAVVFVNDVRIGDIIEYAYTINGLNPIFQGNYSTIFQLALYEPVAAFRFRLLWPKDRPICIKKHNTQLQPSIQTQDRFVEYLWSSNEVPAIADEDSVPGWFQPAPWIQISEFDSWERVVRWALPLYTVDRRLSPQLSQQIESWRKNSGTQEERFITSLRFVQDEIRYLGIEMGPHSHMPHVPSIVFSRRYGDCKDKSLLLVAILNALNIEAWPALVNTDARHTLDEYQPTPMAFDHVIVQVKLGNRIYWVDPTISFQRGGIAQLYNPGYQRALVIRDGNKELEKIPTEKASQSQTKIHETYTALRFDEPATLEIMTTYYGQDADEMRAKLAEQTLMELGKSYLNYYSNADPQITSEGLPKIVDDQNANILKITESYHIPGFWKDQSRHFKSDAINNKLIRPSIARRSMPLAIPYPVNIANVIEVHLPKGAFSLDSDSGEIKNEFVQLRYNRELSGDTLKLHYYFQIIKDTVPVESTSEYFKDLDRMWNAIRFDLSPQSDFDAKAFLGILVLGGMGYGIVVTTKRFRLRSRKTKFMRLQKKQEGSKPGNRPESPILLQTESDIEKCLQPKKCRCGFAFNESSKPFPKEAGTFSGQRFIIINLQCEKCGHDTAIYFQIADQQVVELSGNLLV
jgi:transglutaminase-like putative cysteine protease